MPRRRLTGVGRSKYHRQHSATSQLPVLGIGLPIDAKLGAIPAGSWIVAKPETEYEPRLLSCESRQAGDGGVLGPGEIRCTDEAARRKGLDGSHGPVHE